MLFRSVPGGGKASGRAGAFAKSGISAGGRFRFVGLVRDPEAHAEEEIRAFGVFVADYYSGWDAAESDRGEIVYGNQAVGWTWLFTSAIRYAGGFVAMQL